MLKYEAEHFYFVVSCSIMIKFGVVIEFNKFSPKSTNKFTKLRNSGVMTSSFVSGSRILKNFEILFFLD